MDVPVIAVVEYNLAVQMLLDEILTDEGYRTELWLNDEPPLGFIQRHQPDLVILELWLERRGDGHMLVQELRRSPETAHIPLIVCSSDVLMLQEQEDWLQFMGCETLVKPFSVEMLCDTVASRLQPPAIAGAYSSQTRNVRACAASPAGSR